MYVKLIERDTNREVTTSEAYKLFSEDKLQFVKSDNSEGYKLIEYIDGQMIPELSQITVDILYNNTVTSLSCSRMTKGEELLNKLELDPSEYYFKAENLIDTSLHRLLFPEISLASAGILSSHPLIVDARCDYTLTPIQKMIASPLRLTQSFKTGFSNIGNSCYLASAMQSIVHIKEFVEIFFQNSNFVSELNTLPRYQKDVALAKSFAELLTKIYSPNAPSAVNFNAVKEAMGAFDQCYLRFEQEDSHEFMVRFIDHMINAFNKVYNKACFRVSLSSKNTSQSLVEAGEKFWELQHNRESSKVSDLFTSVIINTQSCHQCGSIHKTFEPMLSFSLPVCHKTARVPPRIFDSSGKVIGLVGESLMFDDYINKSCELYPEAAPLVYTAYNYDKKSCIYELTQENYDRKHDIIITYKNEDEKNICILYDGHYFIMSLPDQQSEISIFDLKHIINYHDSGSICIEGKDYNDHDLLDLDLTIHNYTTVIRVNNFVDRGIFSSLKSFSSRTKLDRYCEHCQTFTESSSTIKLWRLSPVIIFHLMRFKNYQKDDALVDYPIEDLDLTPYFHEDSPYQKTVKKYNLTAVSLHSGSLNFGHYTAFVRDFLTNRWLHCNDSRVIDASDCNLVSNTAYILVYSEKK